MQTLTKRMRSMEVAQIIDDSLFEYYSNKGQDVPKWKQTEPEWWIDYLDTLGIDPRNP